MRVVARVSTRAERIAVQLSMILTSLCSNCGRLWPRLVRLLETTILSFSGKILDGTNATLDYFSHPDIEIRLLSLDELSMSAKFANAQLQ